MNAPLLSGPLPRSLLKFSVPLVLGMVGHAFFNFVDVWLVGRLGAAEVSGVHLATIINFVPMILFNGIGVATAAFLSQAWGRGDQKAARELAQISLRLTYFLGIVFGLGGYLLAEPLVLWLRADPSVVPLALDYLIPISLGTLTMFLLLQVTAVLRAVGESLWPMILLIGANVLNFGLCLVLIFGWLGFPAMGVFGAALATVIARGAFGILGLWILYRKRLIFSGDKIPRNRTASISWKLVKFGTPSGCQIFVRAMAIWGITSLVQYYDQHVLHGGADAAGAFGIGTRLDMLALFAAAGWGAAATTAVGMNLGAEQVDRAEKSAWFLVLLSSGMMIVIGSLFYFFPEPLYRFSILNPPSQLISIGVEYQRIIVFSYLFASVGIVLANALQGAGVTRLPLFLDAAAFLFLYPIASWAIDAYGLPGIWWTIVGTNGVLALLYAVCFYRGNWKAYRLGRTVDEKQDLPTT